MDLSDRLRRAARSALGLRAEDPAEVWRYGLYRARVDACDGSTVDVTPEDSRLSPAQGIPLRQPIPHAVVNVAAGAICRLGWDGGDPSKPYALPCWDAGGQLTSLTITGGDVTITGGEIAITASAPHKVKLNGGGRAVAANNDTAGPYPIVAQGLFVETA